MYSAYIIDPERFLKKVFDKTNTKIGHQMINFSVHICVTELYCVIEFLTNVIDMCTIVYNRRTLLIERREYIRIENLIHSHSHRTS